MLFGLRLPRRSERSAAANDRDDDGRLIELARAGDLAAFNLLVGRHERAVYSVCVRYMRTRDLAEDVSQDTFIRAWGAIDTFRNDDGEGFRAWLLAIAANRARDVLRARSRRPAESLDERVDDEEQSWEPEAPNESPIDFATRGELGEVLESALGQVQPDQRLAVILSDIHGHPYDEIAAITGVAVGTVKSRINRGRARLREILLAEPAAGELFARRVRPDSGDERG